MKIKGNKKDNTLVGSDGDDKIQGLGGDDNITAKGGHDTVSGGAGDDKIKIAADTSATIDAGKGNDTVKIGAGALGSDIDLGKGDDTVDFKESSQSNQTFNIDGGKGNDSVNFALGQDAYTITENGDEGYTVIDANGNSYALSSISALTFNGVAYVPPVVQPNQSPVLSTPIADQTATVNSAYSFQVAATAFTDPDNDTLVYTATLSDGSALPSWLTFDAATRTFSGTPTSAGAVTVRVTASDGSLTASDDFVIGVTGGTGTGGGGGGGEPVSGQAVDLYADDGTLIGGYASINEAIEDAHENYRIEVRDTSVAYGGNVIIDIAGLKVNGNGAEIDGGVAFLGTAIGASLDGFEVSGTLPDANGFEGSSVFVLADDVTISDNKISSDAPNALVGVVVGVGVNGVTMSDNEISDFGTGAYINPTTGTGTTVSGNNFSGNGESLVIENGVVPVSANTFDDVLIGNDIRISLRTQGTYDIDDLIGSANSFGIETVIDVRLSGGSTITGSDLEEHFSVPVQGSYENQLNGSVTLLSSLGNDTYDAVGEHDVTYELTDTSHSGFQSDVMTFDFSGASGNIPLHIRLSGSDFQGAADLIAAFPSVGYFGIGRNAGAPADDFFILGTGESIARTPGVPVGLPIPEGSQSLVVYENLGGYEFNLYFDANGDGDLNAGDAKIHIIGLDHTAIDWA